jgi:hypothetical protein
MKRAIFLAPVIFLASCQGLNSGENVRQALDAFCRFKQSEIAAILVSPQLLAAGRAVCGAIGDGLGNPG